MKNMNYGERLKWARKRANLTQTQLSELSNVGQGTISKIERGDQSESAYDAIIGHHLKINPYWLSTGEGDPLAPHAEAETMPFEIPKAPNTRMVPLISWVKAGEWCESPDNYAPGDAENWIESPFSTSARSYCLTVDSDSMSPDYREGEIILVDPDICPVHGDDIVARTPDGKHTFKRLQITSEGTYLLALNPDHPKRKIEIPVDTVICGTVIGSWMKRRR